MTEIQKMFPFFEAHPNAVYLDSAATTQKPHSVISAIQRYYQEENANGGRGTYPLAWNMQKKVEAIRESTASFLGVSTPSQVHFHSGATEGCNQVALSLALHHLRDGDEILYCPQDHKSFVQPWFFAQAYLEKKGVHIKLIPYRVDNTGGVNQEELLQRITPRTKVINITHVHNIYGTDNELETLIPQIKEHSNALLHIDGTQAIGHQSVCLDTIGPDFYTFSGHKMFGPTGIGASFYSQRGQQAAPSLRVGGGQEAESYEAGTPNYGGIIGLGAAIEFLQEYGLHHIQASLATLTSYTLDQLRELPNIEFSPGPHYWSCRGGSGILSFRCTNIPALEVALALAQKQIYLRAGDHCSAVSEDIESSLRISLHIYNTKEDIDTCIHALQQLLD